MTLTQQIAQALAGEQMHNGSDYSEHELEAYGYMDIARTVLAAIERTHQIVSKTEQLELPLS